MIGPYGPRSIVKCDGCDTRGERRSGNAAPDFWFYLESTNNTPGKRQGEIYIVYACSIECRDGMWKRTGHGIIDEEGSRKMRADIAAEPATPVDRDQDHGDGN